MKSFCNMKKKHYNSKENFIELLSEKYKKYKKIRKYYKKFEQNKSKLIKKCFKKINREVFNNHLPKDFEIRLSKRLFLKSGYCSIGSTEIGQKFASITLSESLCSKPGKIFI